jgi:hypothetical protein
MEFYRTLPFPKLCPGEKGQTKVDGGRIQGVNCLIQFDTEGIFGVEFSGSCNQDLGEIGINPPIPGLVGMGQGVPGNLSPNTKMIKFCSASVGNGLLHRLI